MLRTPFEHTVRQLCEDVLSEPTPEALPQKIIDHLQATFPVQWSTLWLTEQWGTGGGKRLRLAAAGGIATRLMTAEKGGPAVYDFEEGLTGEIAHLAKTRNITRYEDFTRHRHAKKYDLVMYGESEAENQCRCVLGVPLLLKSVGEAGTSERPSWRVIGVLKLENIIESSDHPVPYFTEQDVEVVEAYAAVIAVALEKAQMRADSVRIGAGLLEVSRSLLAELGERPRLDGIVQQTAKAISAEACSLWLRSGLQLRLEAAHGYHGSRAEVPPYDFGAAADHQSLLGRRATDASDEEAKYRGVGLTVYVAQTGRALNLTTASAVREHFAWQGANDERMWGKPKGQACYSLVAIPLIDNETRDLMGVFKIENKKPTLFQLQSYFTKEDEQLLTILGNSISFSLIISERIERLRRLERLVGDVRVLYGLEEALFFILTGLTHRDGLQYNRAMIYLVDDAKPDRLVCQFAIGQIDPADWQREMDRRGDEPVLNFDTLLDGFRARRERYVDSPMMARWKGHEVDRTSPERAVIARHGAIVDSRDNLPPSTAKYLSGGLPRGDMLAGFANGDFVLIPIMIEKTLRGIIYADNRFTGNRVNRFECAMLDLFAGMAGAIIQASGIPEKLQVERDVAWRTFSQPAAHRLGTEAGIIATEAKLYIERELEAGVPSPDGRVAIREYVIRNSLKVIKQAVGRLRNAVRDYQRLAFEAEEAVEFELCALIEQTIRETANDLKGIEVSFQSVDQPLWIRAARGGIRYVFEELLINAWKESQPADASDTNAGSLTVRVSIEVRRERDQAICILSDDGSGVPEALSQTLFHKLSPGRRGGTGLGLYLSDRILKGNGGRIEVLSMGKPAGFDGACFRITLPLCVSRYLPESGAGARSTPNVLVVEDNPVLRRHLSRVLVEKGFVCQFVPNENEAMKHLSTSLRTIVADIDLSEAGGNLTGGIRLAEQLRDMGRKIPIILISQDPWYYLPPMGSPEFNAKKSELSIIAALDRNSDGFYEELITALRSVTST